MEYQGRSWTGDALMNRALGYIQFAFDSRGARPVSMNVVKTINIAQAEGNPDFTAVFGAMPREGMASIGFHSWIYVHGLACLLADGLLELGDDELLRCLETAGGAFFSHISRNGG